MQAPHTALAFFSRKTDFHWSPLLLSLLLNFVLTVTLENWFRVICEQAFYLLASHSPVTQGKYWKCFYTFQWTAKQCESHSQKLFRLFLLWFTFMIQRMGSGIMEMFRLVCQIFGGFLFFPIISVAFVYDCCCFTFNCLLKHDGPRLFVFIILEPHKKEGKLCCVYRTAF